MRGMLVTITAAIGLTAASAAAQMGNSQDGRMMGTDHGWGMGYGWGLGIVLLVLVVLGAVVLKRRNDNS